MVQFVAFRQVSVGDEVSLFLDHTDLIYFCVVVVRFITAVKRHIYIVTP